MRFGWRTELANEETLWQRRLALGTRNNPTRGRHYNDWWDGFGATHPEYFAELPAGYSQPSRNAHGWT